VNDKACGGGCAQISFYLTCIGPHSGTAAFFCKSQNAFQLGLLLHLHLGTAKARPLDLPDDSKPAPS
jgi:hypothetical protein